MRWRALASIIAVALAAGACSAPPVASPPRQIIESAAAPTPPSADDAEALHRWLSLESVSSATIGRRVFYTWTHADQIDEMRAAGRLLLRVDGQGGKRSGFDERLSTQGSSVLAQLLVLRPFSRRRFAWPNPWATAQGFGDERYGDVLVRVVLKPDSVIGRFEDSPSGFVDVSGHFVSDADVIAKPERLAAVYHETHEDPVTHGPPYREYVLCNESAIEEWSVGDETTHERLSLDAAMLHRFARARRRMHPRWHTPDAWWRGTGAWTSVSQNAHDELLYVANVGFLTDAYRPDADALDQLARVIEARTPTGFAIVQRPDAPFPRADLVPATPASPASAPPCIRVGSVCRPIGK